VTAGGQAAAEGPAAALAAPVQRVSVCALTLHRPQGVDALLGGLQAREDPGPGYDVRVVIVDNDPEASARPIVERWRSRFRWPLHYAVQPQRGIPFGRNMAVATAGDVDAVAFLDDDEVPDPRWLAEILAVRERSGADIVTGTVLPRYEGGAPEWVLDGRFFDRPRFATGQRIGYARTSNVLIGAHVFPPGDPAPFNEAMGLNGGDDTHFFMRARLAGHTIVWADEAVVVEEVPRSRMTSRWLMRREYRRGNTLSLCLRDLQDSPWRRVRRFVLGVVRIAEGVGATVLGVPRGRAGVVAGLQRISFGCGLLSGLFGARFDEYATIHGR
jgi:glycosyltransferase involved in cell wall biosynthesis